MDAALVTMEDGRHGFAIAAFYAGASQARGVKLGRAEAHRPSAARGHKQLGGRDGREPIDQRVGRILGELAQKLRLPVEAVTRERRVPRLLQLHVGGRANPMIDGGKRLPQRPEKSLPFIHCPSAVTISADNVLSQLSPWRRPSRPMPPPSVRPVNPVSLLTPVVVASPCTASPHRDRRGAHRLPRGRCGFSGRPSPHSCATDQSRAPPRTANFPRRCGRHCEPP